MRDILDIQDKLQDTAAAVYRLRSAMADHPGEASLSWELRSMEKRQARLSAELAAAADAKSLDVCNYRIVPESRLRLAGVATALVEYQSLVTVFFEAVKRGGKQTGRVSPESVEATAFDFRYAYAGSAGFVFTIPRERSIFLGSDLDDALAVIDEVVRARSADQILAFSRRLGRAPIRALYEWANTHTRAFFHADIEWRRGDEVRHRTLVQLPEFAQLKGAISETSEETDEEVALVGMLVGADSATKTFHFRTTEGLDVRGSSGGLIDPDSPVVIPNSYTATVRRVTRTFFSTDHEQKTYTLVKLVKLSG